MKSVIILLCLFFMGTFGPIDIKTDATLMQVAKLESKYVAKLLHLDNMNLLSEIDVNRLNDEDLRILSCEIFGLANTNQFVVEMEQLTRAHNFLNQDSGYYGKVQQEINQLVMVELAQLEFGFKDDCDVMGTACANTVIAQTCAACGVGGAIARIIGLGVCYTQTNVCYANCGYK